MTAAKKKFNVAVAGATGAGIRDGSPGRLDLALLHSERPCAAAAVFTTNRLPGASLQLTRRNVASGRLQAVVANSDGAIIATFPVVI